MATAHVPTSCRRRNPWTLTTLPTSGTPISCCDPESEPDVCGIVGLHASSHSPEARARMLAAMNGAQVHRGPDGEGTYVDESTGLGLAMRRLAIIDIAGGSQPMQTEDGRYSLIFNG